MRCSSGRQLVDVGGRLAFAGRAYLHCPHLSFFIFFLPGKWDKKVRDWVERRRIACKDGIPCYSNDSSESLFPACVWIPDRLCTSCKRTLTYALLKTHTFERANASAYTHTRQYLSRTSLTPTWCGSTLRCDERFCNGVNEGRHIHLWLLEHSLHDDCGEQYDSMRAKLGNANLREGFPLQLTPRL